MAGGTAEQLKDYQYGPGQSGNPSGRPPGTPRYTGMTVALREIIENDGYMNLKNVEVTDEEGKPTGTVIQNCRVRLPNYQIIAISIINKAAKGNVQAFEKIVDRMDGKVPQTVQLQGNPFEDMDHKEFSGKRLRDVIKRSNSRRK